MYFSFYISIGNLTFLESSMSWFMLGLLIPIIIHFLSKREKKEVSFGSLRFLQSIESESAKSFQLSQYALLFFRLLLLSIVCLLLMGPMLANKDKKEVYYIEDPIYRDVNYEQVIMQIPEGATIHTFSHNLKDSKVAKYYESSWTLIDQLNRLEENSVVYSHSFLKNFIGQPISLSPNIEWIIVPIRDSEDAGRPGQAGMKNPNWSVIASDERLASETKVLGSDRKNIPTPLNLSLIRPENSKHEEKLLSIIELSSEHLYFNLEWVTDEENQDVQGLIIVGDTMVNSSLSTKPSIRWIPSNQRLTIKRSDDYNVTILGRIDRESILETNLPVILASQLNKTFTSILDHDIRVFNPLKMKPTEKSKIALQNADLKTQELKRSKPLHSYILLLVVPVFIIERFLSMKDNKQI